MKDEKKDDIEAMQAFARLLNDALLLKETDCQQIYKRVEARHKPKETLEIEETIQKIEWLIQEKKEIIALAGKLNTCYKDRKTAQAIFEEFTKRRSHYDEVEENAPCSMTDEYYILDSKGNRTAITAGYWYKILCDDADTPKDGEAIKIAFISGMLLARKKTPAEFAQDKYSGLLESVIETNGEISEAIAKKIPSKKNTPDKITQEEAAKLWHVSVRTIHNWITGKYQPPDEWPGGLHITIENMKKCADQYIRRRNGERQAREALKRPLSLDAMQEKARKPR